MVLSVPDLDQKKDELMYTAKQIVESIAPKIKDEKIFEILSNTYYEYKKQLQFIKELVVYKKYHKIYEKGDIKNKEPERIGRAKTSEARLGKRKKGRA